VDAQDTEELAGAMVALTQDPERCAELSRRGLERAAKFTWAAAVEKTWQVYRELAGSRAD
jgi:glycosyltransferase involved in cell wall biosynthesis